MSTQLHPRNVIENVIKNFDSLISATSVKSVLEHHRHISKLLHYEDELNGLGNFSKLKNALNIKSLSKWNRVASILKTLDSKTNQKEYVSVRAKIQGKKILVIGGGISGLRVSIELLLLGAKVICVEKRDEFTRNNVIHLWPNVINDMYTFEAKRFYGQFCVGSIDHISIRQLQLILLKIAIIYGLKFYPNTTFIEICPRIIEPREYKCKTQSCDCCCHIHGFGGGAYAHFLSDSHPNTTIEVDLNRKSFDVIIGCDGRRNTFSRYFPRNNRRGKLAIGLTANFVNLRTEEEAHCPEISGISRIYNQNWFKNLQDETDIELENLVYYRDDTHYFVMTATKASLLKRGVLKSDFGDSHQLLHLNNIDAQKLIKYSKDAAEWSSKLRKLEFARNSNNMPDVALFDFTSMYSATNASCAKKIYLECCNNPLSNINRNGNFKYMLLLLCGDSLLEPFWPTGSGAGRGFLSALDAAWTVSQWFTHVSDEASNIDSMLNVISKREYVYRLLAQTSPENTTSKNFTIDPQTRYKNLNILNYKSMQNIKAQVRHLIIDKQDLDVKTYLTSYESKRARRVTVGIDPQDILKAKNLLFENNKHDGLDECNFHHHNHYHIDFHNKNNSLLCSVPSSNIVALNKSLRCDNQNKQVEVIELKPKNVDSTKRHVDVQPRNNNNDLSSMAKKNHYARNHFFNTENFTNSTELCNLDKHTTFNNVSSTKNCTKDNYSSHQYEINNHSSSSNKENFPIPDFKQMFDFDLDNFDNENKNQKEQYHHFPNSLKNRFNMINNSYLSIHDFEKSLNRKPKKSSDILEKAHHLAQKFEELNKPYVSSISKVGKIEEDDWNVKIWNNSNIFAPKIDKDKRNLVNQNRKDLLQSRITQLNNNMEYKKELPKSTFTKMSNEYVNLLSNEVCQKLNNTVTRVQQQKSTAIEADLKSTHDSVDSVNCKIRDHSNMKPGLEFLKPIGDCKRCNKTLLAIDRVTISGQQFHKNCLTCKTCSVMLRQDEVLSNEDFTCKICTKSRYLISDEAKNTFLNSPPSSSLNLSLIEAKKNFLVNVEQIDLRERAEFEIMESEKLINPNNGQQIDTNDYFDNFTLEEQMNGPKDRISNLDLGSNEEESSELTESDDNNYSSDTNYTDDEHSDSEDFHHNNGSKACNMIKDDYGLEFTSLITATTTNFDSDVIADSNAELSLIDSLISKIPDSDAFNHERVITNTLHDDDVGKDKTPEDLSLSLNSSSFIRYAALSFDDSLSSSSFHDNTCDNNQNLIRDRDLNREEKFPSLQETISTRSLRSIETTINNNNNNHQNNNVDKTSKLFYLPYRYTGQFTEKFYRSMSQPSLYDQLNLIDHKLKKRSPVKKTTKTTLPSSTKLNQDLPFADGAFEDNSGVPIVSSLSTPKVYNNSTKLTQAPFAKIDDV